METLSLMERAIVANNFKKKTISFRNVRDCGADEKNRIVKLLKSNDYDMLDTFDRTSKTKGNFHF